MGTIAISIFLLAVAVVVAGNSISTALLERKQLAGETKSQKPTFVVRQNGLEVEVYEVVGRDPVTNKLVVRPAGHKIELLDRNSVRDIQ